MNTASELQVCRRFIGQGSELSSGIGARFILVYVPTKISVYKDLVKVIRPGQDDIELTSYASSLAKWSKAMGIEFHDLTPALTARARDGDLVYFLDDEHWTPSGHTLAANEIAKILRAGR